MNFSKNYFSIFCLAFSLIIFIYLMYRSEIFWNSSRRDYYLNYQLISFLSIIFSIFTFFLKKKLKEYLIVILISSIFSFYISELYLTKKEEKIYKNRSKIKFYEKEIGYDYDNRTLLKVFEDSKKENENITIRVYPNLHLEDQNEILPLSGISNIKTIFCNENGFFSTYFSDRYGFNNPDYEWDKKEIEYLLIGDSYVHGACVNRPNDVSSQIRKISKKSVLNLGYGGNGPLLEYATLREYYNQKVKKVIWVYYEGNDLDNLNYELTNSKLLKYINDKNYSQNLNLKQKKIDLIAKNKIFEKNKITKFEIDKFIKLFYLRQFFFPAKAQKQKPPNVEFEKITKLIRDFTLKNDMELHFVYLPDIKQRYVNNYIDPNYSFIRAIVKKLNINFIDIDEQLLKKSQNPLDFIPFRLFGHLNSKGYEELAKTIIKLTSN